MEPPSEFRSLASRGKTDDPRDLGNIAPCRGLAAEITGLPSWLVASALVTVIIGTMPAIAATAAILEETGVVVHDDV